MLSLPDLFHFAELHHMPREKHRGIVREYIQTLILFYLQRAAFSKKYIFIGGTALRFFYDLQRFSEDLDFNYLGTLNREQIGAIMSSLRASLRDEQIEMHFSIHKSRETYFHWKVYAQFPQILQHYGCAGRVTESLHPAEELSIQLDFQNLGRRTYPVTRKIINRFGKRFLFNTPELDMFLAEKSNAMLFRKVARGRDFFDFMSLVHFGAKLNFSFLRMREVPVKNFAEYQKLLLKRIRHLDFQRLTAQLSPFLFQPEDAKIMKIFPDVLPELLGKLKKL